LKEFDSFVNLLKYQNTTKIIQLENYTTELFVFLLNYLIYTKNKIIFQIIKKFGFDNTIKLDKLNIYTQCEFAVGKRKIIPDIIFEYNKIKIIIEVKVDSELNQYNLDGKTINQLELYSSLKGITSVYLLTKRVIQIDSIKNKKIKGRIFWSQIYNLLENSNDFIIQSFNCFLEENGMKTNKLNKNISTALDSLSTLSLLIKQSWNYDDYPLSPFSYSKDPWFGCYVYTKNKIKNRKDKLLWLGLEGDVLLVHFMKKKIAKKYLDAGNKLIDDQNIDFIYINDIIKKNTPEDQKVYLTEWFIKIMGKLKKYLV
jgi:hypothetical protein